MFEPDDLDLDEDLFANLPDDIRSINCNRDENQSPKPSTSKNFNSPQNLSKREMVGKKKVIMKRKFPGPAGLFPESNEPLDSNKEKDDQSSFLLSSQLLCSQSSNLTFQEATWQDMCRDFDSSKLLKKYDIEWIKNNVSHNFINKKVPFLAGIVKEVKNTSKTPIFVLADRSGEIEALVSSELYEEYNEFLISNSVLILKQFGILSVSPCKHYVNVTIDNLIRIYSCKDSSEDYVKIVHIKEISISNLERDINEFVDKYGMLRHDLDSEEAFNIGKWSNNSNTNKFLNAQRSNNRISGSYVKIKSPSTNSRQTHNDTLNINKVNTKILQECNKNVDKSYENASKSKKFNFKSALKDKIPSSENSHSNVTKSIFEHSNNYDLDLRIDDFNDDFLLPQNVEKDSNGLSNDIKKRKVEMLTSRMEIRGSPDSKNVFNLNDVKYNDKSTVSNRTLDIKNVDSNKLDCTQISIISQNSNEHPDIIKEVFSDLDASALFDDF